MPFFRVKSDQSEPSFVKDVAEDPFLPATLVSLEARWYSYSVEGLWQAPRQSPRIAR
jgi:hypothetical protein